MPKAPNKSVDTQKTAPADTGGDTVTQGEVIVDSLQESGPGNGNGREVVYPKRTVVIAQGDTALTVAKAKELLGWEEVPEGGGEYLLKDHHGKAIRCTNNAKNRPFYIADCKKYSQEILRRRWYLNMENIIIGKYGSVLSGQHRLIALVLAGQLWDVQQDWKEFWVSEPVLDTTIAYGADESSEALLTYDTGKPQSLSDVIYRSEYFAGLKPSERRIVSTMLSHAISRVWDRTGGEGAFDLTRTHAESLDFLSRHSRLVEAVSHMFAENKDGSVNRYLQPGNAAGVLYLMGCSSTDPKAYRESDTPDEADLNFGLWDRACDFWTCLVHGAEEFNPIRAELETLIDEDAVGINERIALYAKAWACYANEEPITPKAVKLDFKREKDDDGFLISRVLAENPTIGGIDQGFEKPEGEPEFVDGVPTEAKVQQTRAERAKTGKTKARGKNGDPTPDQIAARRDKVRAEGGKSAKGKGKGKGKGKENGKSAKGIGAFRPGNTYWVRPTEQGAEPYQARMTDLRQPGGNRGKAVCKIKVSQGFQGAGTVHQVPLDRLCLDQPRTKESA